MKKREMGKIKVYEDDSLKEIYEEINKEFGNHYEIIKDPKRRSVFVFWKKRYEVSFFPNENPALKQFDENRIQILKELENDVDKELKGKKVEIVSDMTVEKIEEPNASLYENIKIYLKNNEIDNEVSEKIVEQLIKDMKGRELEKEEVIEILKNIVMENIDVYGEFEEKIKTVVLIGPTGVGKTTTLAKIAGKMKNNGKMIGFVATDLFRMEAVRQLKKYADIMKSPTKIVTSPEELQDAIGYFRHGEIMDNILIDTVGRSGIDPETVKKIKEYLNVTEIDHVAMVLSATQKSSDLEKIIDNFKNIKIDSVIFTKLDETLTYGNLFNVLYKKKIKVSYITDGQQVPKDIHEATKEYLVEKILNGVREDGSSLFTS